MTQVQGQSTSPAGGKNPGLATLLSLLCCGAGQIYNGDTMKGAIMFGAAVLGGILFGVNAAVLVIPLILYGMVDANMGAQKVNEALILAAEQREASAAASIKQQAETVSAQDFVQQIEKLHRLASSNLLNADEFAERKKYVLMMLNNRRPREAAEDFLTALIPLARSEALTTDELTQIKSLVL